MRRVVQKSSNGLSGCVECGAAESPRWRRGPAGALTLCNVCGLLLAKRVQIQASAQAQRGLGEESVGSRSVG